LPFLKKQPPGPEGIGRGPGPEANGASRIQLEINQDMHINNDLRLLVHFYKK